MPTPIWSQIKHICVSHRTYFSIASMSSAHRTAGGDQGRWIYSQDPSRGSQRRKYDKVRTVQAFSVGCSMDFIRDGLRGNGLRARLDDALNWSELVSDTTTRHGAAPELMYSRRSTWRYLPYWR
ncbi:hypothetical protein N7462_011331 [Penicillium macrosclerotiorum]|uniref:uncharacterized protein n=1 Tax=Penicillium macrosclerotiorum TaxID=303699 RepID=UPI00254869F5|nr:uncharacterized protein N7462_011331 [Penicillium macrosclerotiorum]KAJ5666922.1 hypothetical protein N7462_011331 [Penicillium macrosclerotiorum]